MPQEIIGWKDYKVWVIDSDVQTISAKEFELLVTQVEDITKLDAYIYIVFV